MDEKLMQQILEGIKDLQKGQLEIKSELRSTQERMDRLERRQMRYEKATNRQFLHLIERTGEIEEHVVTLHAGQNTIRGLCGNILDRMDILDDNLEVTDQAFFTLRDRVKKLED